MISEEQKKLGCFNCRREPEPGWIEMGNNGPVVPCPVCNHKTDRELEFERALAQRAGRAALKETQGNE